MKDKLLVFVSFPGSGEGCSRLCFGFDMGGISAWDDLIGTADALECGRSTCERLPGPVFTGLSLDEVLSGCRLGLEYGCGCVSELGVTLRIDESSLGGVSIIRGIGCRSSCVVGV